MSAQPYNPHGWAGDPRRGAALGQPGIAGDAGPHPKFRLERVRLDSGGYEPGGTYWGIGAPLYCYTADDGDVCGHLRAESREDAKRQVGEKYPGARFYR
jgi:hypothetical protein